MMKFLQDLVPGCNKMTGKAVMLGEIINYDQSQQRQVEFLSMKFTINQSQDHNLEALLSKNVLALLFHTSARDPGIIPRASHPPEEEINFDPLVSVYIGGRQTPSLQFPRTKEVMVNGKPVKIKYCDTRMLYRPPRCSHCSICNICVERFDNHCPWVGQCIGQECYP